MNRKEEILFKDKYGNNVYEEDFVEWNYDNNKEIYQIKYNKNKFRYILIGNNIEMDFELTDLDKNQEFIKKLNE